MPSSGPLTIAEMAVDMIERGVRRIHVLGWRDLDDPEAGGSEVHADEFMRRWAAAGLDVLHRTSGAAGRPAEAERNGYRVVRRGSRYSVFPRTAIAEILRRMGPYDALVEIWNGVPWMSPVWCRAPRITVLHHVHGPMWDQILPGPVARIGRVTEARLAPPFYRRTRVVTPSEATRDELLRLGFRAERVTAVDNGVDPFFSPGGAPSARPRVVVVGRFAPVKRIELAIDAIVAARREVPALEAHIVGDGPRRDDLVARVARHGATGYIRFRGYLDREQLRDEYRRAWVVLSASLAEGWGLTLTEAAACGTPAVASDIAGHRCSVVDGVTGLLAPAEGLGPALVDVLRHEPLRRSLSNAAAARAKTLTWEASATGVLAALHGEVVERQPRR